MKTKSAGERTRKLAECAVMIAAATVLSMIKIFELPLGGAVTLFSMVPVIIVSFRHGVKWGIGTAFVYSVLQLVLGMNNVLYVPDPVGIVLCILFDYIFAFSVLGLAGLFEYTKLKQYTRVILGTLSVCLLRFCCHVVSGAVVWYSITKSEQWNELVNRFGMWTYSLVYNVQFMLPETIITLIAVPAIIAVLKRVKK